jgi:hypothetical protein
MTTERDSRVTLAQVRDNLREDAGYWRDKEHDTAMARALFVYADVIDAHLAARDAVVSDEDVERATFAFRAAHIQGATDKQVMLAALSSFAARHVVVPDAIAGPGIVMSKQDVRDAYYAEGWNACRQAMLASKNEVK